MWSFDSNDVNEYIFIKKQLAEQVQVIQDEAEAANITHTLWINTGSAEFYFKKDVKTKADVAGLKMAGPPGGALGILQLLGASPVGMDNSEMYLSAQTGVIDGVAVVPLSDSYKLKFYEVLPYYVLTNTMMATFSTLMNSDSFAALTPKLQDVVTEAAAEAETWGLDAVAAGDADVIDTLENTSGVHVYTLPDAERQLWFDSALAPLFASMYSKMGVTADVVTEVQSIAADAKVDYAASK
jgi:TRAP-type C4-dicarboxylate transport system substrate-binding protein